MYSFAGNAILTDRDRDDIRGFHLKLISKMPRTAYNQMVYAFQHKMDLSSIVLRPYYNRKNWFSKNFDGLSVSERACTPSRKLQENFIRQKHMTANERVLYNRRPWQTPQQERWKYMVSHLVNECEGAEN
jgi:hypothetical protein